VFLSLIRILNGAFVLHTNCTIQCPTRTSEGHLYPNPSPSPNVSPSLNLVSTDEGQTRRCQLRVARFLIEAISYLAVTSLL
jgi:hypothetical protein